MTKYIVIPLDKYKRLSESKPSKKRDASVPDPWHTAETPKTRAPWPTSHASNEEDDQLPEAPRSTYFATEEQPKRVKKRPSIRADVTPPQLQPPPAPPGIKRKWLKMKRRR